jgi:hypothetical protein
MADIAASLVDELLPEAPYRQWVLTFPWLLRFRLAVDRALFSKLLGVFLRTVFAWQRRRGRTLGIHGGQTGSVSFVQRFGGAMNLNPHIHSLLPDGLFVPGDDGAGTLTFVPLPDPTPADIEALTFKIARRLTAVIERLGADEYETEAVLERTAAALRQALATAVEPPLPKAGLDLLGLDSPAAHRNFEAHSGLVTVVAPRDRARPFCPSLDCSWRSMRGARPRLEAEVVGEAARGVARPSLRGPEPGALRVESWRKGAPGDGGETAGERAHGLRVAVGPALRS